MTEKGVDGPSSKHVNASVQKVNRYVRLDDIARTAGVSKAVVSYVIRNKAAKYRISDETCKRVRQIVKQLGYIPHAFASSLRSGGFKMLGLVVQDISYQFYSELARGVTDLAHEHGYNVIYCSTYSSLVREKELVFSLLAQRIEGLILLPANPTRASYLNVLVDRGVPLVLFQNTPPDKPLSSATFDDAHGTYLATHHLLSLGHRKVMFCGTCNSLEMVQIIERSREKGFLRALQEFGISDESRRIFRFHDHKSAILKKEVTAFFRRRELTTGLVCISDHLAMSMVLEAQSAGLRVPQNISIIGNDDIDFCQYLRPELSSVHFPRYEMGQKLASMIFEQIKAAAEQHPANPRHDLMLPTLALRGSCGAPPKFDESGVNPKEEGPRRPRRI